MFPRPGLFLNRMERAVWVAFTVVFVAASVATAIKGPVLLGLLLLLVWLVILRGKFWPRILDIRSVAYKTSHGVSVVFRGVPRFNRIDVEAALDKAIAAHGHAEALSGYGLMVSKGPIKSRWGLLGGVVSGGWLNVTRPDGRTGTYTLALITHEASHVLLHAAGAHDDTKHHELMAWKGTL